MSKFAGHFGSKLTMSVLQPTGRLKHSPATGFQTQCHRSRGEIIIITLAIRHSLSWSLLASYFSSPPQWRLAAWLGCQATAIPVVSRALRPAPKLSRSGLAAGSMPATRLNVTGNYPAALRSQQQASQPASERASSCLQCKARRAAADVDPWRRANRARFLGNLAAADEDG